MHLISAAVVQKGSFSMGHILLLNTLYHKGSSSINIFGVCGRFKVGFVHQFNPLQILNICSPVQCARCQIPRDKNLTGNREPEILGNGVTKERSLETSIKRTSVIINPVTAVFANMGAIRARSHQEARGPDCQ